MELVGVIHAELLEEYGKHSVEKEPDQVTSTVFTVVATVMASQLRKLDDDFDRRLRSLSDSFSREIRHRTEPTA